MSVLAANLMLTEQLFFPPILYPFRVKIVRFIIFMFLSSISHSCVFGNRSKQRKLSS